MRGPMTTPAYTVRRPELRASKVSMRSVSTDDSYAARSRCAAFSLLLPLTTAITRPFGLDPHVRSSKISPAFFCHRGKIQ